MQAYLGIDMGGTKMAAGVVGADGEVLSSARRPTPAQSAPDEIFDALLEVCDEAIAGVGPGVRIAGVGCGCGGPMEWPSGVVSPLNLPAWQEYALRDRLVERWPDVRVRLHNDAVALVAAHHWTGDAIGVPNLLAMVVGTGVGSGLIIGGRVIDGSSGNAGHIGHVVVDPRGAECGCGGRGCLEGIARGPATTAWAIAQGWKPRIPGAPVDAQSLADDARSGDPIALAAYRRAGEAIGVALASAEALLDLDVVVIGGGLAGAGELLMAPAREAYEAHARVPFAQRLSIVASNAAERAGIIGAAAFVAKGDAYWNGPG